jgi:hypothetical protein
MGVTDEAEHEKISKALQQVRVAPPVLIMRRPPWIARLKYHPDTAASSE